MDVHGSNQLLFSAARVDGVTRLPIGEAYAEKILGRHAAFAPGRVGLGSDTSSEPSEALPRGRNPV